MTTMYSQCSGCKRQKKTEIQYGQSVSFGCTPCEKCGDKRSNTQVGGHSKPAWWDDSKEAEVTP